jgi:hypothetical protein
VNKYFVTIQEARGVCSVASWKQMYQAEVTGEVLGQRNWMGTWIQLRRKLPVRMRCCCFGVMLQVEQLANQMGVN